MEENSIKWSGYEYEHTPKSADWFWAVSITAISIAIIAIIYDNMLFGIFIVIAAFMMMTLARREPEIVDFILTPKGLKIKEKLYIYKDLDCFWVDTHIKEEPELIIKTKKSLHRMFFIPLFTGVVDAHQVRDYLLQVLKEEHMEEALSHRIMRRLGL
jgi:hypothetical protein